MGASGCWAVGVLVAVGTSGCSFLFVDKPPERPSPPSYALRSECTTSNLWPIVDSVIGGYQIVRTAYGIGASDAAYAGSPISREADVTLGAVLATTFIASAITGYGRTAGCRRTEQFRMLPAPMTPRAPAPPPPEAPPPPVVIDVAVEPETPSEQHEDVEPPQLDDGEPL